MEKEALVDSNNTEVGKAKEIIKMLEGLRTQIKNLCDEPTYQDNKDYKNKLIEIGNMLSALIPLYNDNPDSLSYAIEALKDFEYGKTTTYFGKGEREAVFSAAKIILEGVFSFIMAEKLKIMYPEIEITPLIHGSTIRNRCDSAEMAGTIQKEYLQKKEDA